MSIGLFIIIIIGILAIFSGINDVASSQAVMSTKVEANTKSLEKKVDKDVLSVELKSINEKLDAIIEKQK